MKVVPCAVTLDHSGDSNHYESCGCLIFSSLLVVLRFADHLSFYFLNSIDGAEVTLSGVSLSGYATSPQDDICSSMRRKDFC